MTIVRKKDLNVYQKELKQRFEKLTKLVSGDVPNPNIYNLYHNNPDQYAEEFREINEFNLKLAISDFDGILKELKQIKKHKANKL